MDEFCWQTRSICRGKDFWVQSLGPGSRGKYLIFWGTQISLQHSVGKVERSSHVKEQIDLFSRFDKTPTCDRQTDRHRLEAIANNHASIALNGEKLPIINLTKCLVSTCMMPSSGWEDTNPVISIYLYGDNIRLRRKTTIKWLASTCTATSSGCEDLH